MEFCHSFLPPKWTGCVDWWNWDDRKKLWSRDSEESVNEKRIYASVPYIKGTSERLKRAFKSHEVTLVHKPFNSLRSQLFYVKDKTENLKKCGTVYHIHCEQCDKDYVGETSRLLKKTRVKEHLSRNSSAVHEHCQLTGHSVGSEFGFWSRVEGRGNKVEGRG